MGTQAGTTNPTENPSLGFAAEHRIAKELEPVKGFLRRPGSAWWSGAARGGWRPASGGGRAQDWGGRSRSYSAGICGPF